MSESQRLSIGKIVWVAATAFGLVTAAYFINQREGLQGQSATARSADEKEPQSVVDTNGGSGLKPNLTQPKAKATLEARLPPGAAPSAPRSTLRSQKNNSPMPAYKIVAMAKPQQNEATARREFRQIANDVFRRLPTMKSMSGITAEQAHGVPAAVQEAGTRLGQIAQSLEDDPRLARDGVQFYTQCYQNPSLIPQVRAVCLADARHWRRQNSRAEFPPETLSGVPPQVIELSKEIPD